MHNTTTHPLALGTDALARFCTDLEKRISEAKQFFIEKAADEMGLDADEADSYRRKMDCTADYEAGVLDTLEGFLWQLNALKNGGQGHA